MGSPGSSSPDYFGERCEVEESSVREAGFYSLPLEREVFFRFVAYFVAVG
ncbi:unnamed protein product [Nezara viridula]|uniref:Uncharacterized protein n=1 Tax=Nezara viridula TaxID=85310 RepID=A0A9P0HLV8_NEZVI|nr:unnamed protein product [Nezara viridula]